MELSRLFNPDWDGDAKVAIVIPAYKDKYLDQALASIEAQTCRRFRVYVGDDASPQAVQSICDRWAGRLPLNYRRFDENLGSNDLVGQWHRCIDLSHEPWIWLFSDDDIMEPDCVAAFYQTLEQCPISDVYHFNTFKLGPEGEPGCVHDAFPDQLRARAFAHGRFTGKLKSYAPDYLFSRAVYERCGGFVSFPLAWCSDDATWVSFCADSSLRTIPGPRVGWRLSHENISGRRSGNGQDKWQASVAYLEWLAIFLREHPPADAELSDREILGAGVEWLMRSSYNRRDQLRAAMLSDVMRLARSHELEPLMPRLAQFFGYSIKRFLIRG